MDFIKPIFYDSREGAWREKLKMLMKVFYGLFALREALLVEK